MRAHHGQHTRRRLLIKQETMLVSSSFVIQAPHALAGSGQAQHLGFCSPPLGASELHSRRARHPVQQRPLSSPLS